ncbi:hypothetical protein [Nonlabens antarcticus]|uniref:hypothetical protein n=1 Tax=Nonlabens antarcticus TaxID=392714 RepID=UPI001890D4BF|nr:hypothetical protein [Nonlabens antarcticus]
MFATIVKAPTQIAILLLFIFLAKLIAIEGNGLNMLFSGSEISFVKSHCKKSYFTQDSQQSADFSDADPVNFQIITFQSLCNSAFQLEVFTWDACIYETGVVYNEHHISNLSYPYIDNSSPPPQGA